MRSKDKGIFVNQDKTHKECNGIFFNTVDQKCCDHFNKDDKDVMIQPNEYFVINSVLKDETCTEALYKQEKKKREKREANIKNFMKRYSKRFTTEVLNKIVDMDPTKKLYLDWIATNYNMINEPDLKSKLFLLNQLDMDVNKMSYNEFKSVFKKLHDFGDISLKKVKEHSKQQYFDKIQNELDLPDYEVLYDDVYGTLTFPYNYDGSVKIGKNSSWCVQNKCEEFEKYSASGPIYIWYDKQLKRKFAFQFEHDELRNDKNDPITKKEYMHLLKIPVLNILFRKRLPEVKKLIHFYKELNPTDEEKNELQQQFHLTSDNDLYQYALLLNKRYIPGEKIIAKNPFYALNYALYILKRPWEPTDNAYDIAMNSITSDPRIAYSYCINILEKPWRLYGNYGKIAEQTIASSVSDAYNYAINVLHGRFVEGEKEIAKYEYYAYQYAINVLKRPWSNDKFGDIATNTIMNSVYKNDYLHFIDAFVDNKIEFEVRKPKRPSLKSQSKLSPVQLARKSQSDIYKKKKKELLQTLREEDEMIYEYDF